MGDLEDIEEIGRPDWKLLAWPISGFFTGLIVTGAFVLFAIYHAGACAPSVSAG